MGGGTERICVTEINFQKKDLPTPIRLRKKLYSQVAFNTCEYSF